MGKTTIGWTEETWNPVRGCSRVSAGCTGCYAEAMAARFSDPGYWGHGYAERTKAGPRWTGKVDLIPEKLAEPLSWRTPRMCFVNSTSDLFHERLPFEDIAAVYGVMAACPRVTFQVLTKRPERRREFFRWLTSGARWEDGGEGDAAGACSIEACNRLQMTIGGSVEWPLPNVWEGTSVENQETADRRRPELQATPAAVRFVSYEPALGPVDFHFPGVLARKKPEGFDSFSPDRQEEVIGQAARAEFMARCETEDWIIVGGESGPSRRPFEVEWVRSTVEQCHAAGVACFVKQDAGPRPGMQGRIPDDLWAVKEFPGSEVFMIEYKDLGEGRFSVRLAGKRVGRIEPYGDGFRYRAGRSCGDVFATVEEVKRSLEEEGDGAD